LAANLVKAPAAPVAEALDHDLYAHRRIVTKAAAPWPGGHNAAAFFLIRLQALELFAPTTLTRDARWNHAFGNFAPDYRSQSLMEYGNRIGIFRLLDFLLPLGWRVAVSVNGIIADRNPGLLASLKRRGVEIAASGWSAARMISSDTPVDLERSELERGIHAITRATGERPTCYASQDYGYTAQTPRILRDLGVTAAVDWPNDEMPFAFGPERELLMFPAAAELEDSQMVAGRRLQSPVWSAHLLAGLRYWAEYARPGTVIAMPLHAWISGAPHRFANFQDAMRAFDPSVFWQANPKRIEAALRGACAHRPEKRLR